MSHVEGTEPGSLAPTAQVKAFQDYAYGSELQDLMQKMLADVFSEQPRNPIEYMMSWLNKEQERRRQEGK